MEDFSKRPPQERPQPPKANSNGSWSKWMLPLLLLVLLFAFLTADVSEDASRVPYSVFKREVAAGNVASVTVEGDSLWGQFRSPIEIDGEVNRSTERFRTRMPPFGDDQLMAQLEANDVRLVSQGAGNPWLTNLFIAMLPLALLVGIWFMLMRKAGKQLGGFNSVTKSRAKLFSLERPRTTFMDVAGAAEAKADLKQIIEFLKSPNRFRRLGCTVPKGVLLVGSPGTGKTLLARAVAGEAGVPFYSITGSDFMEMFVGVGAARVRDLFSAAKRSSPCIIFLDELDSVGRHRGTGIGGGHDEREQTLNQLLSEMDGFEENENIVVVAATNRPDILDPALLRPGRFDRRITVDMPSLSDRHEILKVHTRHVPLANDVDMQLLARSTPGMSGADLKNLVNEAALQAAKADKDNVDAADFSEAYDKIVMGNERGSVRLSEEERHIVAIHESGHALVAVLSPNADPLHKVSIIPRGHALGITQQLPVDERHNYPMEYLVTRLCVLLGGRAAEVVASNSLTNGAENDLVLATKLARKMVTSWGMSERIGHIAVEDRSGSIFLGEQLTQVREYSERTAWEVDMEIKRIVEEAFDEARNMLEENRHILFAIAEALEEKEVVDGKEIIALVRSQEKVLETVEA